MSRLETLARGWSRRVTFSLTGIFFLQAAAQAHPGHGSIPAQRWDHYVLDPFHASSNAALIILVGTSAVTFAAWCWRRQQLATPARRG